MAKTKKPTTSWTAVRPRPGANVDADRLDHQDREISKLAQLEALMDKRVGLLEAKLRNVRAPDVSPPFGQVQYAALHAEAQRVVNIAKHYGTGSQFELADAIRDLAARL